MFPSLDLDTVSSEITKEEKQTLGISFLFDFKKNEFVLQDGKMVKVGDVEAVKIWVEKVLRTDKFKFKIYEKDNTNEDEYGVTIKKLIMGKRYPVGFIQSELKREITETMLKHPEISRIENFRASQEIATSKICFTTILKDNRTIDQEVIF